MLVKIHPENPQQDKIEQVVKCLQKGGVIIYPTDTIYGLGCDINNPKAIEKICRIKGIKPDKARFSFICSDLSHITDFTRPLDNAIFKTMKKCLPGPYTFILQASNNTPKLLQAKRKTIGIRIPNHEIPLRIVATLGNPILTTSIKDEDDVLEYSTDPELIHEKYENLVDMVIDGGFGNNIASTVVDCSENIFDVIREGAGDISIFE